ncbi:BatD family protein [Mucilaginibacter xinganensis]|uniref:Oxygen tolerance n=1 Tax=Mucilaginibacter xinganensis TaxID=1234841 RepID=A0A223NYZ8_9SPHI|nr:BatD family protein [Mucilaginibacter xinganensis]ASU35085.1 Oxygen tolerance [Mucilaginibacter xinganensis]
MMKKCFFNFLVLIAISTCFTLKAEAQNISVEAKLDQQTIRIGDQTKLRLIVHQPVKEKVNFPKLADTLIGKVQILSSRIDTVFDKKDRNLATVTQSFVITSFDQGTYDIPSYSIGSGTGVLKTNPLTLVVQTVQVDTTKAIYDIKQPLAVTYTFWDWLKDHWIWVAVGVLVVLLAGGAIWYFKKQPKVQKLVKEVKPEIPAHTIALNKLQQLRDKKLWQQDAVKQYHSELSDIIREYLEKRYVIKTQEKTTDEIFAALKYMDIANEYRVKLNQVLILADLVKFAKEKPLPVDNELSIENALSFVLKTQQAQVLTQHTEGGREHV